MRENAGTPRRYGLFGTRIGADLSVFGCMVLHSVVRRAGRGAARIPNLPAKDNIKS